MNKIQFDKLLKPLVEIYDDIELDLINNILDRIENYKNVQGSLEWYLDKLTEIGILESNNLKVLKKNKIKIEKVLKEIVNNIGKYNENLELLTSYFEKGLLNVNPIEIYNSESINKLVNNALKDSEDILELINTKAIEGANQTYKYIINKAYLETGSGVYTYTESIRRALNEMAEIGIQTVHYKSGRSIGIEAAVRRDVITRMNKLVGDVELKHCEELGTNLVYVDQHLGARIRTKYTKNDYEAHAEWQGKKYMIDGSNDKYENLYEKTGYGEMLGLKGINCYHNMRPTWEWEEIPDVIDEVTNKEKYELYQQQRAYERKIRKLKRKRFVSEKTNDNNYENINNEYQELSKEFNNWLKDNGLNRDYAREYISENKISNNIEVYKEINYEDISEEMIKTATPNSHEVLDREFYITENGERFDVDSKNVVLEYNQDEKDTAIWLEDTFGGEIYMNPKINKPDGYKTADYLFRSNNWDKKRIDKSTSETRAVDNAISNHKEQSKRFILDISGCKLKDDIIIKQVQNVFNEGKMQRDWVEEIMIIRDNKFIKWYKKRLPIAQSGKDNL